MRYAKVFSREASLLLLQAVDAHQTRYTQESIRWTAAPLLAESYAGLVAIYYREDTFSGFEAAILAMAANDATFVQNILGWYGKELAALGAVWRGEHTIETADQLQAFIDRVTRAWCGQDIAFFVPGIGTLPEEDREAALRLREQGNSFVGDTDRVLLEAVRRLFPALHGYEPFVTEEELHGKIPSPPTLEQRAAHYIYMDGILVTEGSLRGFTAKRGIELEENLVRSYSSVKGTTAAPGHANGLARIILRREQIPTFRQGEVLVAPMTTPEYLPAMRLAAAIVTDEGGVTSHAAIIARELGIPCVVGTKRATEEFADGEALEVDATAGIVRRVA